MSSEGHKINPEVELYIPRKCSSSGRLIGCHDHCSIQLDFAEVDPVTGIMIAGKTTRYAIVGRIRGLGESDDSIYRLAKRDGMIPQDA